jgi:hypothetical protein
MRAPRGEPAVSTGSSRFHLNCGGAGSGQYTPKMLAVLRAKNVRQGGVLAGRHFGRDGVRVHDSIKRRLSDMSSGSTSPTSQWRV